VARSEAGARAYETWKARHGRVAEEIERHRDPTSGAVSYDDLQRLKERYPEAVGEYVGLNIYSAEVRRKMRQHSPGWEPPPLYSDNE
jgi:hypothetical protein